MHVLTAAADVVPNRPIQDAAVLGEQRRLGQKPDEQRNEYRQRQHAVDAQEDPERPGRHGRILVVGRILAHLLPLLGVGIARSPS